MGTARCPATARPPGWPSGARLKDLAYVTCHGTSLRISPEEGSWRSTVCQRAGVAVSRPMLVTVSAWPAGTTAEYSAVQHEGQQYWRNTMGAST
jgi:hypothetical protein